MTPTTITRERLATAFADGVGTLTLDDSAGDEVIEAARQAGHRFAATRRWAQVVGDRLDTTALRAALGLSRQALAKRVEAGTIIAVPGTGTTWYPTWQFHPAPDGDRLEVRPIISVLLRRFRDALGADTAGPNVVSWAATEQPELDHTTPQAWIRAGGADDVVVLAAERAAAALAR
ncbi:hypothetical protein BH24ACT5_BH24ACT5_04890 [soil metagenome]